MSKRDDFCNEVNDIWLNHGIYVWGGNGELVEKNSKLIFTNETSPSNISRVLRTIALFYDRGYNMSKAQMVDCSGLVVSALRKLKLISQADDYRAKDLQKMSKAVKLAELKPGDLVFNALSDASHVGVYVGYDMVIESEGRLYGVVKRQLSEGSWKIGGRLKYFE